MNLPVRVDLEKLVLGEMLTSSPHIDAIRGSIEQPEVFSLDIHRTIWKRITDLYDANKPIDRITVAIELSSHSELESIGGREYLLHLNDEAPQNPCVVDYCDRLKDALQRRRMIFAAQHLGNLAADALTSTEDVIQAFNGSMVDITSSACGSNVPISTRDMITEHGISALMTGRREKGVRLPWPRLSEALGGLSAGQMVVLMAATSRGKSSMALQIATCAAGEGKTPAIWTMEMNPRSLFQRMITQMSGVYCGQKMITFDERALLGIAASTLNERPIYFDPKSRNVPAFMASLRQIKSKSGLGIAIVDYLQLIRGSGRNRAQEVSDNSRALKLAAMDLGIPFVVLSQVDRGSVKGDGKIGLHSAKECVTGDTLVFDAESGCPVRVDHLEPGTPIACVDGSQKVITAPVSAVWKTGKREVWTVTTQTGKRITATANHPFLTAKGWTELSKLSIDSVLASAWQIPGIESNSADYDLCRFMGYMAGDGTYLGWSHSVGFISNDAEAFADVESIVDSHWPGLNSNRVKHPEGYLERNFGSGKRRNPLKAWFEEIGCLGQRDSAKHIPEFVFRSGRRGAAEFIAGYLASDGCVKSSKQAPRSEIHFDSTSRTLLDEVQVLLLKLGVVSSLSSGALCTKSTKPLYRLSVSIVDGNIRKFCESVPARGKKGRKLREILARPIKRETCAGIFTLPIEISEMMWERSGNKQRGGGWTHQGKRPRRSSAADWAESHKDAEVSMWAHSDLIWEGIRSIESAGEQDVFDLAIPRFHNFVANGIVVHNSGDIENDADAVLWIEGGELSRDQDTIVALHVGKQREGPAGFSIPMVFSPKSQTFAEVSE